MTPRVHIAHVVNDLVPAGTERQLVQLTRHSGLSHEIIEFATLHSSTSGALPVLRRHLEQTQPSVIVAWLEQPQLAVALVAGRLAPLVGCVRGFPRRRSKGKEWLYRWALSRYDVLVANSAALRSAFQDFAKPFSMGTFHVIPNGVEREAGSERPDPARPLRVGFIGRGLFDHDKGLDVLLDALSTLEPAEVQAVLIGKGVPESLATFDGLRDRCRGFPALEDPWPQLGDVDVLVVPSRSEGSPNVVIEAFMRGVPVIATAVGGALELLRGERGFLVPPEDPAAIAAAVRLVMRDPVAARRRARLGRAYAVKTHAWPRVAAAYDSLFLELALHGAQQQSLARRRPRSAVEGRSSCAA
jgi:glycosyltransferase involved in cell wall biosynthesis